jgi:general secretion pathway protein D
LNIFTKKLVVLVCVTLVGGCTTIKSKSSSKTEKNSEAKKISKIKKDLEQLPPLFKKGSKPLLIQSPKDSLSDIDNNIAPCYNSGKGKDERFILADLKSELIPLSYSSTERVVASLQVMGIKTVVAATPTAAPYTVDNRGQVKYLPQPKATIAELRKDYSCSELPVFYKLKEKQASNLTNMMAGPAPTYGGGSNFRFLDMSSADYGLNDTLVAFYHPEQIERFENIKKTISNTFDTPPVQVFIESMVLEVNEDGMDKLGMLYKSTQPQGTEKLSQSFTAGLTDTVTTSSAADSSVNLYSMILQRGKDASSVLDLLSVEIQALITKGYAEVLSRPSVIALNNRPAVIEVTEQKQFPIRNTVPATQYTGAITSFTFEEVTPGILLQIRPKVADEKNEVAMQIDVQVKALVSGNDGKAYNDGTADDNTPKLIATKPGSSTRRVHTFAIVPNKTPIIIGGLVSRDTTNVQNKIPYLGDIPYIGKLFGATMEEKVKKELIVVITPHIIRDTKKADIHTPKDTDMFDDMDMDLFHDSYRVRTEDVFDLGFVYQAQQFQKYRDYVVSRSAKDKNFAKTKLAKSYVGEHFPGADALVARMIYDIVGKRKLENDVSADRIIITEHAGDGKFKEVTFLKKAWEKAKSKSLSGKNGQGKQDYGLELKFSKKEAGSSIQPHVALRIIPKAEIRILSETSKHDETPSRIFISSEKDMKKIRKALVVREILKLNTNEHIDGSLNEFHTGTKLVLPVIEKTRHFLLDLDVATAYHQSKYYYPILEQSLRKSFRGIDKEIKSNSRTIGNNKKLSNLPKKAIAVDRKVAKTP